MKNDKLKNALKNFKNLDSKNLETLSESSLDSLKGGNAIADWDCKTKFKCHGFKVKEK